MTGAQIEASRMRDSTELLRSIPGVSVVDRGERNSAVVNGVRIRGLNVDSAALGDYAVSAVPTVSTYVNDTPIFANFLLNGSGASRSAARPARHALRLRRRSAARCAT